MATLIDAGPTAVIEEEARPAARSQTLPNWAAIHLILRFYLARLRRGSPAWTGCRRSATIALAPARRVSSCVAFSATVDRDGRTAARDCRRSRLRILPSRR